jgi:dCTP deaminase
MKNREHFSPGVLAKEQLEALINEKCLTSLNFPPPEVGPSAIDLRLGKKAWKLRHGQRLTTREYSKIQAQSDEIKPIADVHGEYFEFEARSIYLVELDHVLELPSNISGRATGKSSIGRLDVITRLVTINSLEYDLVEPGPSGRLHLMIMPQTFSIRVEPGGSVNQLRLFSGPQCSAAISGDLVRHYGTPFWYTKKDTHHEPWPKADNGQGSERRLTADPLLFDLTVDLGDVDYQHVFKAKQDKAIIDIRKTYLKSQGLYDPVNYFDAVPIDKDDGSVVLNEESFYIMKSRERLAIPNDVAVEVIAISERIGDIRIHYAGFAHPGFGRAGNAKQGTPLIFEVRATDMATKLYDKSILARVQLFRMSKETQPENSDYEGQELKLSKVFKEWPTS